PVAGSRVGAEDDESLLAGDALSAEGEVVDRQLQQVVRARPLHGPAMIAAGRGRGPYDPPVGLADDLEEYRREAEAFLREREVALYLHGAGHRADLPLAEIHARHADLFGE